MHQGEVLGEREVKEHIYKLKGTTATTKAQVLFGFTGDAATIYYLFD